MTDTTIAGAFLVALALGMLAGQRIARWRRHHKVVRIMREVCARAIADAQAAPIASDSPIFERLALERLRADLAAWDRGEAS